MVRRIVVVVLLAASGCRSAPAEVNAPEQQLTDSRATSIPKTLRCSAAADCAVQPSCYWSEPSCVAADTIAAPQCGDDADPPDKSREPATCGCREGQCVVN